MSSLGSEGFIVPSIGLMDGGIGSRLPLRKFYSGDATNTTLLLVTPLASLLTLLR